LESQATRYQKAVLLARPVMVAVPSRPARDWLTAPSESANARVLDIVQAQAAVE
jgi:hypothetical protein